MIPLQAPSIPSPDEARRKLIEELSRSEYERPPGLLKRMLDDFLSRLLSSKPPAFAHSSANLITALVVLVVLAGVVLLIWRLRPEVTALTSETSAIVDATLSAEDYRRSSADLLGAGQMDEALIAAFRAIVADMIRRTVLGRRPGDTAQEVARSIGEVFPGHLEPTHRAASLFDRAAYGQRHGTATGITADDVGFVRDLDATLSAARPQHHTPQVVAS